MNSIRIVCLSGSLRRASYNTAALRAMQALAPPDVEVVIFEGMGNLPLFNPDLEDSPLPAVSALRHELRISDGLVIASPEYAHGISGVLKNALDWLVSGEEFPNYPVALINTSPRASHAQAALREVLQTMSGNIIDQASISLPLTGSHYNSSDIISDPRMSRELMNATSAFRDAIIHQHSNGA